MSNATATTIWPCGLISVGSKDCNPKAPKVAVYDSCTCDEDGKIWPSHAGKCFQFQSSNKEFKICDSCDSAKPSQGVGCVYYPKSRDITPGKCVMVGISDSYEYLDECKALPLGNACPPGRYRKTPPSSPCEMAPFCPTNVLKDRLYDTCCLGTPVYLNSTVNKPFCERTNTVFKENIGLISNPIVKAQALEVSTTCAVDTTDGEGWSGCHCPTTGIFTL